MSEPTPKTVLKAVVKEVRSELRLINPDLRRVGLMLADGLEALVERAERVPEPVEVRVSEPPELHTRKGLARAQSRQGRGMRFGVRAFSRSFPDPGNDFSRRADRRPR